MFAGGWTIEAAEQVCNPAGELGIDTPDGLTSLADKSLIRPVGGQDAGPRFAMLQVIREFADERLEAGPDAAEVRRRHGRLILSLAEEAEPQLMLTEVRHWQRRLRREEDNIRAALRWAIETEEAEIGLRTAGAFWRFWHYWAEFREGRGWLESLLALPAAEAPSAARAKALGGLGSILYWQGDAERAEVLYGEAVTFYRQLGDDRLLAEALWNAAWSAIGRNDFPAVLVRSQEALELFRRSNDAAGAARVTAFLRTGAYLMGGGGSLEEALATAREAVELNRQLGRLYDVADWLGSVGFVYYRAGDYSNALDAFRESIRVFRDMENLGMMLPYMKMGAALELALGRPERAVRLAAVAARAVEEIGGELPAAMIGDMNPMEEARLLLPEDVFARAVEEGRAMTFDEAAAYALEEEPDGAGEDSRATKTTVPSSASAGRPL